MIALNINCPIKILGRDYKHCVVVNSNSNLIWVFYKRLKKFNYAMVTFTITTKRYVS